MIQINSNCCINNTIIQWRRHGALWPLMHSFSFFLTLKSKLGSRPYSLIRRYYWFATTCTRKLLSTVTLHVNPNRIVSMQMTSSEWYRVTFSSGPPWNDTRMIGTYAVTSKISAIMRARVEVDLCWVYCTGWPQKADTCRPIPGLCADCNWVVQFLCSASND